MQSNSSPESLFSLTFDKGNHHNLLQILKQPLEKALYLKECENIYSSISDCNDSLSFIRSLLSVLNVRTIAADDQIANIPSRGPAIVIANHPFGAIEGLILARLLCTVRPDVKVMANYLLSRIPQLKELFIPVDPFNGDNAVRANIRPMRDAIRWVRDGHVLVVFPAGEVSHFKPARGEISDPKWNPGVVTIIRKTEAPVLPAFFKGANSPFFQIAGLLHPRLRTAMLARELLNKRRKTIELKIGGLIPFNRLEHFVKNSDLSDYLRWRTYLLGHTASPSKKSTRWPIIPSGKSMKPVVNPQPVDDLADEIKRLPADQQLAMSGDYVVWHAEACQIPCLLHEIGRLREISFRAANEGTGKPVDLDRFDPHYHHLFIWHRKNREIVGAYRIGCTDTLLNRFGTKGLYTSTLFRSSSRLFDMIGPSLELGRSFVQPEYQRSYIPLLLLWKGIGSFIVNRPRYRMLFGPVSISRDYSDLSRQLIASTLLKLSPATELAAMVRPKTPPRMKPVRLPGAGHLNGQQFCHDMEEVCAIIGEIELGINSIPILLKHYLNLGGKLLSFNIDKKFGDSMDGLILVDLLQSNPKTLQRYFGKEGLVNFYNYHKKKEEPTFDPSLYRLRKAG